MNITRRVEITDSSNIQRVGYSPKSMSMYVTFKHGGTYQYSNVMPTDFGDLVAAESVGKHFAQNIKGQFPERMISG